MNDLATKLQTRRLGKTDIETTILGLGGGGALRSWARQAEAVSLIWRALELGVTFFDCAHDFAGSEDYHGQIWGQHPRLRTNVFLSGKSSERTKLGARRQLEMTLRRMKVEHLDLWQVHDLRTQGDWDVISGPGGALEAFVQAHQAGLVRFIGVAGHYDPTVLERAISEFEFHTLAIPVNPAESKLPGFLDTLLPLAAERDIGIIGDKVMGGDLLPQIGLSPDALVRFALSQPVSLALVSCDTTEQLEANLAASQLPFTDEDISTLDIEYDPVRVTSYRKTFEGINIMDDMPPDLKTE